MAKPIEELLHLGKHHYGVAPSKPANPYIEVSMIDKHQINECLEGVTQFFVHPIAIKPKAEFKDLQEALTKPAKVTEPLPSVPSSRSGCGVSRRGSRPPPVSSTTRFKVSLLEGAIPLSCFFNPPLHMLLDPQKSTLVEALHTDVNVLCAIAMTHQSGKNKSAAYGHHELFNEQQLFCALLRALTKAPWILHQQCETTEDSSADIHLPRAKFDLMINHGSDPGAPASANVVIKVNGDSEEKPDLVMTNKTDTTTRLHALNVSAVLESFIFAEINEEDATRVIIATESYMRPQFRIKSLDILFTTDSVVKWCDIDEHHNVTFNLEGCILFLLLVKSGTLFYPAYQPTEVYQLVGDEHRSGWSAAYSEINVKYSKTLQQTIPQLTNPSRGSTVDNNKLKFTEDVGEVVRQIKRKRHSSGGGTSS